MATPTRPCPYCGAAVLTTSPHCGNCGRPVPPAPQGPGQAAPAKTIFGYQAPKVPGVGGAGGVGAPGSRAQTPVAGSPAGLPGPQRSGAGSAPGFGSGQPASAAPAPAYQPPQQPAPAAPAYQPPAQQYGAPPSAPPPSAAPAYQPPPQQPPPSAAPPAYQQPPQQQGYGAPPQQQGGYPPQQPGYPPQQPGYPPQQPGYPPQHGGYPPQQGGGLAGFAARLPQSAPGTLFGIPLATLRDPNVERKALLFAGVALLAALAIPIAKGTFVFSKGAPKFTLMIWPIMVAAIYLLIAAAPAQTKQKIPTVVLKWAPFLAALLSIGIVGWGFFGHFKLMAMGEFAAGIKEALKNVPAGASLTLPDFDFDMPGSAVMYLWGYPIVVFGLLARMANPQDFIARIIIGVGAFFCLFAFIDYLPDAFEFDKAGGGIYVIHHLLMLIVMILAVGSAVFVPTPQMVPSLAPVDAFAPHVTAVLLLWIPIEITLLLLGGLVHAKAGASALFVGLHEYVNAFAFFGILMLTSPEAYDAMKLAFAQRGGGHPPGGYGPPPGGGGYGGPPPGGGYGGPPPQGGGYPPPQGGGYPPPQGGGYPPQGGGGWPQQ